ncbi:hypothetical protein PA598K_03003 [Paenibacillus sp. 598K]|uniref:ABC transporter substrate-binding protein n=1 Tax=Paenibacillus sp. 598K TaxID=1117987 RepID=UPI000FF96CBC|nr:ABC transporter substrate-binding protein [Paenibacillus sp. 598K]GBF74646.1 hypothetical protein PA598K_03003 [Paenibacillus sp. 598K]
MNTRKIRTMTALILLATLVLSACGAAHTNNENTASAETPGSQAGNGALASENAPSGTETAAQESATATRTFEHVMGSIEAPAEPQRVIAVYMEDYLAALGVKPVMQTVIGTFSLQYLSPYIGDLPPIDTSAISFEAALAAQPDLIVLGFPNYASEGKYESFSAIAPTYVFGEDAPNQWRESLLTMGKLLGKEKEAEQVLADYTAKVEQARATLKAAIGEETVAMIRMRSDKELRLYGGPGGYVGNVMYTDLGLTPPDIVKELAWGEKSMVVVSQEIISDLKVDHLFVTYDEGGKERAEEMMASTLWQSIPAVQKGQVYEVAMDHWMTFGPLAYNQKVDDLLAALAK